jgi:hypothetical protein
VTPCGLPSQPSITSVESFDEALQVFWVQPQDGGSSCTLISYDVQVENVDTKLVRVYSNITSAATWQMLTGPNGVLPGACLLGGAVCWLSTARQQQEYAVSCTSKTICSCSGWGHSRADVVVCVVVCDDSIPCPVSLFEWSGTPRRYLWSWLTCRLPGCVQGCLKARCTKSGSARRMSWDWDRGRRGRRQCLRRSDPSQCHSLAGSSSASAPLSSCCSSL